MMQKLAFPSFPPFLSSLADRTITQTIISGFFISATPSFPKDYGAFHYAHGMVITDLLEKHFLFQQMRDTWDGRLIRVHSLHLTCTCIHHAVFFCVCLKGIKVCGVCILPWGIHKLEIIKILQSIVHALWKFPEIVV